MVIKFSPNGFLDIATDASELPSEMSNKDEFSGAMRRCKNLHLDKQGIASTRKGSSKLNATALDTLTPNMIVEHQGDRYVFSGTKIYRNEISIKTGLTDAQWWTLKYNAFNSLVENILALNGTDRKRIVGDNVYEWGIDAPTIEMRVSAGGNTGLTGTYNAKYTYARKEGNVIVSESNPSDEGDESIVLSNGSLEMICEPPTDPQITHIRLYRTTTQGTTYYHLADIPIPIISGDYGYTFDWEATDAYISGTGYKITELVPNATTLTIHNCDAVTDDIGIWSIVSGSGVTVTLETLIFSEGIGSIKMKIPQLRDGIIKFTNNSGYWDLNQKTYLKFKLYSTIALTNIYLYFGESAYNEQSTGPFSINAGVWTEKIWDISAIDLTARDGVTIIGARVDNNQLLIKYLYIDDIRSDQSGQSYTDLERLYDWEVSGTGSDGEVKGFYPWEPIIIDSNAADTVLGTEISTDHNRPPYGTFLFGPTYTGLCFILKDNLMHYSLEKRPEYWPATHYLEICPKQFPLKAGCIHDGQLYLGSQHEIYQVMGSGHETWSSPLAMSAITGTIAPKCFWPIHGFGILHLGYDGLYLFSGATDQNITNERFKPIFEGETVGTIPGLNKTYISNCWLIAFKNKIYFGYPGGSSEYPDNIIVTDIKTAKASHYDYGQNFSAIGIDYANDRLLAVDIDGYVWKLEDSNMTDDAGTVISWEIESKEYGDQLYKYFPRWARYDVNLNNGATANGYVILNGTSKQTHAITESRKTKKRLITGCTGDRLAIRMSGTGPVDIFAAEVD